MKTKVTITLTTKELIDNYIKREGHLYGKGAELEIIVNDEITKDEIQENKKITNDKLDYPPINKDAPVPTLPNRAEGGLYNPPYNITC